MPRLAASGPISRLGPLSLLHWVFLLRPVRLSARSMGSGADGRAFPSAVDLVYCHRFQYVFSFSYNFRGVPAYRGGRTCFLTAVEYIAKSTFPYSFRTQASCCCLTLRLSWSFRADTLAGCFRKSHVLYFGFAMHALKDSSFFLI